MDKIIYEEKQHYDISGGCTALVAVFFLGKLYVANAGDSRAVIARGNDVIPMSQDFTPESERERLRLLGFLCPDLLQNEFTHLEFSRRVTRGDIGRKVLCRNARMKGWTLKSVTPEDARYPLIAGEGKKARLLATIGVTRGFGDHDLTVGNSTIHIKPFLTPAPEVNIYELQGRGLTENDVLIMGTDGLWDVTSNKRAADIVQSSLKQFDVSERARYTSAAQDLVMNARGLLKKGWRTVDDNMASGDDITAFVIPLHHYSSAPVEPKPEVESSLEMS
ncbi:hypothetical protein CAPTEDRAFT_148108 [Capitella teleta]|nr:hypothetical protein CAPTEDRAFT_148108 [Capitella teleta]|eukprot:ELU08743.1 hypothetical protein CAPTEDRAFT_148108 [Capitella teleta]